MRKTGRQDRRADTGGNARPSQRLLRGGRCKGPDTHCSVPALVSPGTQASAISRRKRTDGRILRGNAGAANGSRGDGSGGPLLIDPSPSPGWTLVRYGLEFLFVWRVNPTFRMLVLSLPGLPPWRVAPPGFEVRSVHGLLRFSDPVPVSPGFPLKALSGGRFRRLKPGSPRSSAPRCPSAKTRSRRTRRLASGARGRDVRQRGKDGG